MICPKCLAPLPGKDSLVCLRCGFDLKSLKVISTAVGVTDETDDEEDEEAGPVVRPGRGGVSLPAAVAGIAGLLLVLGHLFGVRGLFPGIEPEAVTASVRFMELLRFAVRFGVFAGTGLLSLVQLARLLETTLGDVRLAIVRVLAIVATALLVSFIHIQFRGLEWTIEAVLGAGLFLVLSVVWFSLSWRDAADLPAAGAGNAGFGVDGERAGGLGFVVGGAMNVRVGWSRGWGAVAASMRLVSRSSLGWCAA